MIPATAAFIAAHNATYEPQWTVTITPPGGGDPVVQPVLGGSITKDAGRYPRTRWDVDIPTDLMPGPPDTNLLPFGGTMQITYTLPHTSETLLVAAGPILASQITRPDGIWRVSGADPSARIDVDAVAPQEVNYVDGVPVVDWIRTLTERTLGPTTITATGDITTDLTDLTNWQPQDTEVGNPWDWIERAATGSGAEAWFQPDGTLVLRDRPDLAAPVDSLNAADHITGYSIAHERAYSRYVALFVDANRDYHGHGDWQDTRVGSPTNVNTIGRVTDFHIQASTFPQLRMDRVAARRARTSAGRARQVELETTARVWLEPGDTIDVAYAGGTPEPLLLEAVDIPLTAEPMRLVAMRSQYQTGQPTTLED